MSSNDSGLQQQTVQGMDAFLKELSSRQPKPSEILSAGAPWGGLHEKLTGKLLAPGCAFNLTSTPESRPWIELLSPQGTFSAHTLALTPLSFQIGAAWAAKLNVSSSKHGDTWLHRLHLGIIELEVGNAPAAAAAFRASLALKPSVHAARNLAVMSAAINASALYAQAWTLWTAMDANSDPAKGRLGANLRVSMCSGCFYKAHLCQPGRWMQVGSGQGISGGSPDALWRLHESGPIAVRTGSCDAARWW